MDQRFVEIENDAEVGERMGAGDGRSVGETVEVGKAGRVARTRAAFEDADEVVMPEEMCAVHDLFNACKC